MAVLVSRQQDYDSEHDWVALLAQASEYRIASHHPECWELAMLGLTQCPDHVKTQFYFELGVVAFYLGLFKEGLEYIDLVLTDPHTTPANYQCSIRNLKFYIQAIEGKHSVTNITDYYPGLPQAFIGSSLSYAMDSGMLTQCYRTVNYRMLNGKYIVEATPGCAPDVIHTRNFLVDQISDKDCRVRELICPEWMIPYPSLVRGLEDVRLFGKRQFTCTSRSHNKLHTAKVCYGEYNRHGIVTILAPVVYQDEGVHEKNMLPFMLDGHPHVLNLAQEQLLVMKINVELGQLEVVKRVELANCQMIRGSAGPVPYRHGWLFTVHEGSYDGERCYYHRLVWISNDFTSIKLGRIFTFTKTAIEFNIGIYIDHQRDQVVLGYSVNDSSSHELRISGDSPWMPEVGRSI